MIHARKCLSMVVFLALPSFVISDSKKVEELPKDMPAKVRWKGMFGGGADPLAVYCLMGQGFFLAPTTTDIDRQVQTWLAQHPKARIIPVSSLQPILIDQPKSKQVYVWIQDGKANLNLHLVRTGCCPSGTMHSGMKPLQVSKEEYGNFVKQAEAAEQAAKEEGLGIWGTKEYLREKHLETAKKLQEQGKYRQAVEEFKRVLQYGEDSSYPWLSFADCQDKAGDYQGALKCYDKAIGNGDWWPPNVAKARCISRNKGPKAATKWLEKLIASSPKDLKFYYLLGEFHMREGRNQEAISAFEKSVEIACASHGFQFDPGHWLILDQKTMTKKNNDFASLWPVLEYLAEICLKQKDAVKAWKYATMGVSIGQQSNRCMGFYNRAEMEAGDVTCRLVRASVYMKERKWEEANQEIEKAKVLADHAGDTYHQRAIQRAQKSLKSARANP